MTGRGLGAGTPLLPAALPSATPDEIVGLLRVLARVSRGGQLGVSELADTLPYDPDRLLSLLELLQILGFVELGDGTVKLILVGRRHARARERERKIIFAHQLVRRLPLVAHLVHALEERPAWRPMLGEILADLRLASPAEDLAAALPQVISWGRYAGLFGFEQATGRVLPRGAIAPGDGGAPDGR